VRHPHPLTHTQIIRRSYFSYPSLSFLYDGNNTFSVGSFEE
jgi:hypothetical protein